MRQYNTKKSNTWNKSKLNPKTFSKEQFIKICIESESMAHAASKLGLHFNTFKKYALIYNCYIPNQAGKGIRKNIKNRVDNLEKYATRASVRKRIINENLIPYKCSKCDLNEWMGKKLSLHLDHIDGNNGNHKIENLRFLCPNCHSLTDTYTGRNK